MKGNGRYKDFVKKHQIFFKHVTCEQINGSVPGGLLPWPANMIKTYDVLQQEDKEAMTYWNYDSSGTIGLGVAQFQTSAGLALCYGTQ
jgi:hypothetical protein